MRYTAINNTPHKDTIILEVAFTAKNYQDAKTWVQNMLDMSCSWTISKTDTVA